MTIQRCSTCRSEQGFYIDKSSGRSRCLACFAPQEEETKAKAEAPPKPASGSGVTRSKAEAAPQPASKPEPAKATEQRAAPKGKGTAIR